MTGLSAERAGDCPDCVAAGLRMKAQGFRDWRTAYACWEHAAFNLDGPEWAAMMADVTPADPEQPDLFASSQRKAA